MIGREEILQYIYRELVGEVIKRYGADDNEILLKVADFSSGMLKQTARCPYPLNPDVLHAYAVSDEYTNAMKRLASETGIDFVDGYSLLMLEALRHDAENRNPYPNQYFIEDAMGCYEAVSMQRNRMFFDEDIAINRLLERFKTRSAEHAARSRHAKDPKQAALKKVRGHWEQWQADPAIYRSKAAFARDMCEAYPVLTSVKVIEDKCRGWKKAEKENSFSAEQNRHG